MNKLLGDIIPKPISVIEKSNSPHILTEDHYIYFTAEFKAQAPYLQKLILNQTGIKLDFEQVNKPIDYLQKGIYLIQSDEIEKLEAYKLISSNGQTSILAKGIRGIVNGIQTLIQLLPIEKAQSNHKIVIPACLIEDYPAFKYRGLHLDVVRHMFEVEYIKKYIDFLTFYKLNTFHWHLTDDQGWRIEIESYPKLNEIGSWREESQLNHSDEQQIEFDNKRYGGYYTKEQVREIIEYAKIRGVEVIPEIDIPGHSRATIASYPELSTEPSTEWKVANNWRMFNFHNNVLAPTTQTFTFLKSVFDEIDELFESDYIHIGGDECCKTWWKESPLSQEFMKDHNLVDENALQTYFIEFLSKHLSGKGKKIIGWHEILQGEIPKSAIIMNWGELKIGVEAALNGHKVIMSPGNPLYLDHYQSFDQSEGLCLGGYNPLKNVYDFNPIPNELHEACLHDNVLGAQANLWTEYIDNSAKLELMIFPRLAAFSEAVWTPTNKKDFVDFQRRIEESMTIRYDFWGVNYFKSPKNF